MTLTEGVNLKIGIEYVIKSMVNYDRMGISFPGYVILLI